MRRWKPANVRGRPGDGSAAPVSGKTDAICRFLSAAKESSRGLEGSSVAAKESSRGLEGSSVVAKGSSRGLEGSSTVAKESSRGLEGSSVVAKESSRGLEVSSTVAKIPSVLAKRQKTAKKGSKTAKNGSHAPPDDRTTRHPGPGQHPAGWSWPASPGSASDGSRLSKPPERTEQKIIRPGEWSAVATLRAV